MFELGQLLHRSLLTTAACLTVAATLVPVSALAQADGRSIQRSGRVTVDVFTNVTNEPADAWIGRGIAASLAADLNAIARDLETTTNWHVRGAYQRLGTQIRITADLVEQTTEQTLSAA